MIDERVASPDFVDVPSGSAELRGRERQAAEELGQCKTHHEESKVIDASQAAITCRKPSTACAPWGAYRPRDTQIGATVFLSPFY